jgi:hypothetical protein
MRRLVLGCLIGGAAFAASLGISCGDSGGGGEGGGLPQYADVIFEGGATDEALDALIQATVVSDPASAANFTSPTDGMDISSSAAPTFSWKIGPIASADPPATGRRFASASAPARPFGFDATFHAEVAPAQSLLSAPRAPDATEGTVARMVERFLSGVPAAYAHGTPTSGPAFFVLFKTSTNDKLLRVFTTAMSYTPDTTSFNKLIAAGTAITVQITNASFDQNRIAQSGGPWKGVPITINVM